VAQGWSAYEKEYPELAELWTTALAGRLPEGWKDKLPTFTAGEKVATRAAIGQGSSTLWPPRSPR